MYKRLFSLIIIKVGLKSHRRSFVSRMEGLHQYFDCSCSNWGDKIVTHNFIPIHIADKCSSAVYWKPFKTVYCVQNCIVFNPLVVFWISLRFYTKECFRNCYIYANPFVCLILLCAPTWFAVITYVKKQSLNILDRRCWNWKSASYSCNYSSIFLIFRLFVSFNLITRAVRSCLISSIIYLATS